MKNQRRKGGDFQRNRIKENGTNKFPGNFGPLRVERAIKKAQRFAEWLSLGPRREIPVKVLKFGKKIVLQLDVQITTEKGCGKNGCAIERNNESFYQTIITAYPDKPLSWSGPSSIQWVLPSVCYWLFPTHDIEPLLKSTLYS